MVEDVKEYIKLDILEDIEEEQIDIEIEQNMLRDRANKADDVTDDMWKLIKEETRYLIEEYLDISSHLTKATKKQYKSGLRQFFWWVHEVLNDKHIYEISKRDFMRYMSFMQNRGLSSSAMGFKKSAVSAFNIHLENIVAEDEKDFATFRNFTRGLQPIPKNQVYSKKAITDEEYKLMLDTLIEDKNYMGACWVAVSMNVGSRRAETVQFKSELADYEMADGQNYVMSHTVYGKGSGEGKPLEFMVNKEAIRYIKLWLEKRGYEHEYIFTNRYKGELDVVSDSWANYFCTDVLSDILGRRINPHIFKASCISRLLSLKVDMNLVSRFVAQHESIETTSQFYDLREFEDEKGKIFDGLNLNN